MMKNFFCGALILLAPFFCEAGELKPDEILRNLYSKKSQVMPSMDVMKKALDGYCYLKSTGAVKTARNILTVIDFSLSSKKKRFWVIDLDECKVMFYNYVAHGKNTGADVAKDFSNVPNSNKSSLGFYVTGTQYFGKHGLSLRLHGIEKGVNDNAFDRAIVMHGADYVSEEFIQKYGRLGRSFGCPAISRDICKTVVETISDGTCLFIYYPDEEYLKSSSVINGSKHLQLSQLSASDY